VRRLALHVLALAALLGLPACGSSEGNADPVKQVRDDDRAAVRAATSGDISGFPAVGGRSLQEVADGLDGTGPEAVLASSVFTVGSSRLAFGSIDGKTNQFVYGPTAVYLARSPGGPAQGPFPAPADLLITKPAFKSQQAATEANFFAAVYAADLKFPRPGNWSILTVTRVGGRLIGSPLQVSVKTPKADRVPAVGEQPPAVRTDTLASARGDVEAIDTRVPPSDMHERSFSEVVGKKPVALLFATPQLCQSRVCGPVVDIAAQLKSSYGDQMEFIHQEVYEDNEVDQGLREPLKRFNLPTEPWLFVVGRDGRITARLEGSFGLKAFEAAIKTAL
jgi:hypothetical protein